jgi:hypothetical protein
VGVLSRTVLKRSSSSSSSTSQGPIVVVIERERFELQI